MPHSSNDREIPFYHVHCGCGDPLQATAAQAGEKLPCPKCGQPVSIPRLSILLEQSPNGYLSASGRHQFHLWQLMALVTVWAILLSIDKTIGDYVPLPIISSLVIFSATVFMMVVFPLPFIAVIQRLSCFFGILFTDLKTTKIDNFFLTVIIQICLYFEGWSFAVVFWVRLVWG